MVIGIFNVLAIALIALIVWWFWIAKPKQGQRAADTPLEIVVEGGVYSPSLIEAKVGRPIVLHFLRKDPSPCAEKVQFDALGIYEELDVNETREITIVPEKAGSYEFTCQMGMYRGKLIVSN